MKIEIINKTVEQFCKEYTGKKFHALLCDPPYELGFMGKHWDRSGIVFKPETWAMLAQHLHPGAFGFSFASSRGWHRLACAIEDAGNVFHPSVFMAGWSAGSGFPKATRIDMQVDRAAGVSVNRGKAHPAFAPRGVGYRADEFANNGHEDGVQHQAQSPLARAWSGHRYGLQALKPALEPILCWQKPYEGKAVDSITKTGAGALNVDGGRVETCEVHDNTIKVKIDGICYGKYAKRVGGNGSGTTHPQGRWPANLVLSHSPDCTPEKCVEGCAVETLDRQSGELQSGFRYNRNNHNHNQGPYGGNALHSSSTPYTKNQCAYDDGGGGASRFFFNADYSHEKIEFSEVVEQQIANADPIKYQAKASRSEREAGVGGVGALRDNGRSGNVKNNHPTIKPITLTQYIATLLLPPVEYSPRRILIPFSGSGSEIIGAMLAGWDEIVAVEMEPEYVEIAQARVAWWQNIYEKLGAQGVKDILEKFAKEEPEEVREAKKKQMDLF